MPNGGIDLDSLLGGSEDRAEYSKFDGIELEGKFESRGFRSTKVHFNGSGR